MAKYSESREASQTRLSLSEAHPVFCKYRFTKKAVEDLSNIWNYTIETWSERQADLYYEMLIGFCEDIAENPALGKNYEEISESLYGFIANRHIIFYRAISPDEIEVTRILHGSMDLKSRISE